VTFSGDFVGGSSTYDFAAATGGTTPFSGTRNIAGDVFVNRPDGAMSYGGTVVLSGSTNSSGFTAIHAGTLQVDGSIAGPLNVAAAGTLSGTGSVGGDASISGTHSPGNWATRSHRPDGASSRPRSPVRT